MKANDKIAENKIIEVEILISMLLRWGVLISGGIILVGWAYLIFTDVQNGKGFSTQFALLSQGQQLQVVPVPTTLKDLVAGVMALNPSAIISLGLSLLILLPLLRVFAAFLLFLMHRDYLFVLFSGIVLALLSVGHFLGHFH